MQYSVKEINSKNTWEKFVISLDPKSFLQSWNWGETFNLVGDKVIRLGYFNENKLVGVCQIIKQNAKRGPHFLVPGGPLIDWQNKQLVNVFLENVKELARKEKVWFVRVRPELDDTLDNKKLFKSLGLIPAPMHLNAENTLVIDTRPSEEEILSGMRKNTRYLVKRSLENSLSVEITKDTLKTKILYDLQKETVERHKFVGFSDKLFKAQLDTFGEDDQASLFIIKKNKTPLVAAIIIFYGNYAYYHHSGSTLKFNKIPSSYFLQWQVILEAKKRNLKGYNLWGIAPENKKKHRFAGVTTFKTGFGGEHVNWLHAHDLPVSSFYYGTYIFENARKKLRGL